MATPHGLSLRDEVASAVVCFQLQQAKYAPGTMWCSAEEWDSRNLRKAGHGVPGPVWLSTEEMALNGHAEPGVANQAPP